MTKFAMLNSEYRNRSVCINRLMDVKGASEVYKNRNKSGIRNSLPILPKGNRRGNMYSIPDIKIHL